MKSAILCLFVISGLAPFAAIAEEASDWVEEDAVRTRLVSSYKSISPDRDSLYIGWQARMKDGWKTYWRTPGQAGLPPVFSWAGSENIKKVEEFYPLPERFTLFGIETFGYAHEVTIPLRLTFDDPLKAARIRLHMTYMVCKDVCIPYAADYELFLPPAEFADERTPHTDAIYQALGRVPSTDETVDSGLEILAVRLRGPVGHQRLALDVKGDSALSAADIMVEAGSAFMFGKPRMVLEGDGTKARFSMAVMEGDALKDLAGTPIIVTVTDGLGRAIERQLTLDSKQAGLPGGG